MFRKLVAVNKHTHADLRVKPLDHFRFADRFHLASIMVPEFVRAAATYPIVFLEDPQTDSFRPVVLMGVSEGENLFVSAEGKWQGAYIPAIIRRYPFALAQTSDQGADDYLVCVDEQSDFVGRREGEALFDSAGEPTRVIDHVKRYLGELQGLERQTREFCTFMGAHNLFTPLDLRVQLPAGRQRINGCYAINEARLDHLSDTGFAEIRERHYLRAIYAHLTSLGQVERLAELKRHAEAISHAPANTRTPDNVPIH